MGQDFLGRRHFEDASAIFEKTLGGICISRSALNDELFSEMIYIELAEKNYNGARAKLEKYKGCGVDPVKVRTLRNELLQDLVSAREMGTFNEYLNQNRNSPDMIPYLIGPLGNLRDYYIESGLLDKAEEVKGEIYNLYSKGSRARVSFSRDARDVYAGLELENLKKGITQMMSISLSFPENQFQSEFKEKDESLSRFVSMANKIISYNSSVANISAFRYLVTAYKSFVKSVDEVHPTGKSKEYVDSFRTSMAGITGPIKKQALSFEDRARDLIEREDILSRDNFYFLGARGNFIFQYDYLKGGILMDRDRGGGR
jgi:hypothetical protein